MIGNIGYLIRKSTQGNLLDRKYKSLNKVSSDLSSLYNLFHTVLAAIAFSIEKKIIGTVASKLVRIAPIHTF
jgi:hypothetical protein